MEQRADVTCPEITVVENDDPAGLVVAPEEPEHVETPLDADVDEADGFDDADMELGAHADGLDDAPEETVTFLPGEEELEELLGDISDMDDIVEDN